MYGLHIDSTPSNIINQIEFYKDLKCIQMFVNIDKKHKKIYDEFKKLINKYIRRKKWKIVFLVKIIMKM